MALARTGTARLSDIMEHGRMDAGFLLVLTSLRERTDALRNRYSDEEAIALVDAVPLADKSAMKVLTRGSIPRSMSTRDAHDLAREYPHLSLALIAEGAEEAVGRIQAEITRSEEALKRLLEISETRIARLDDISAGTDR